MKKIIVITILLILAPFNLTNPSFNKNNKTVYSRSNAKIGSAKKRYKSSIGIMKLSQIKRGMKGYGITVFKGLKRQRFNVKIIGIIKNESPKGSLILARFSGGPINKAGVIAGMSGSPVYIKNKLIGAVSHTFPSTLEPIGAIRPINQMLKILTSKQYNTSNRAIKFIPLETTLRKKIESLDSDYFSNSDKPKNFNYTTKSGKKAKLIPIKTPIFFSGIDNQILEQMRPEMESYGLIPINSGISGKVKANKRILRTLKPGDAVGITLISGDMIASPVGTVTYKKGNKVLIFGHPSFFKGPISMPMSRQYIHTVIPTRRISFKLSSFLFNVGRVFEDRSAGVAGELGIFAKVIPVNVVLRHRKRKEVFNYKIVKDNIFFPNLLAAAITQSVYNLTNKVGHNSIKFRFNIKVKNLKTNTINTITTNDLLTGNTSNKNLLQGLLQLTLPLQAIMFNPYVKTEILSVKANIEVVEGWKACEILNINILKNKIRPGDKIPVLVTLRNYKGYKFYKKLFINVPTNLNNNVAILGVGSAKSELSLDKAISIAKYTPKNYKHLIKILNRNDRFNDLAIWLDLPQRGLIIEGKEHPNLPSSMLSIMKNAKEQKTHGIFNRITKYYRSNYLIYGVKVKRINIDLTNINK